MQYKSAEVFGISTDILQPSYVDRGDLDHHIQRLLGRNTHIALRGESKCGKSWLRKKNIPNAIVIQCRLNKSVEDLYKDAFSQLDISIVKEVSQSSGSTTKLEGSTEFSASLLLKLAAKLGYEYKDENGKKSVPIGHDLDDLRFVAEVINVSERRLVIEDLGSE